MEGESKEERRGEERTMMMMAKQSNLRTFANTCGRFISLSADRRGMLQGEKKIHAI